MATSSAAEISDDDKRSGVEDANVGIEGEEELVDRDKDFGVKLEPFNLNNERKHGRFDKDGFFVRNANDSDSDDDDYDDGKKHKKLSRRQQARERKMALITKDDGSRGPGGGDDDDEDDWVDEVCREYNKELKGQTKEEQEAQKKKWEEEQREEVLLDEQQRRARGDRALQANMLRVLASILVDSSEDTLHALQRLGKAKKSGVADAADNIDRLSKVADDLMSLGFIDVYTTPRSEIVKLADSAVTDDKSKSPQKRSRGDDKTPNTAEPKAKNRRIDAESQQKDGKAAGDEWMWEYILDSEMPAGTVHGPYSKEMMQQWRSCGFFVGNFVAKVRKFRANATEEEKSKIPYVSSDTVSFTD